MYTCISVIFKITDSYKKRPLSAHEAVFRAQGMILKPLFKPGGYFVFTDMTAGKTCFEIASHFFQQETIAIDVPEAGNGYVLKHIMLNPSRKYPFGGNATIAAGTLLHNGVPLKVKQFYIVHGSEGGELMKIARDRTQPGDNSLKLFVTVPERRLSIPGKYLINDREETKRELCLITNGSDRDGLYPLERPILYEHPRGTPLTGVTECSTTSDGSFFTVLSGLSGEKNSIEVIIPGDGKRKGKSVLEITTNKENNFGKVEI